MLIPAEAVFLIDVDNTLFDNDRFAAELGARLEASFGAAGRDRYWALYAELRETLSYADYLGALQRFRAGRESDQALLRMSSFILDFPFADLLYPRALDVVRYLSSLGTTVILSDGDIVLQPRKIERAGIWDAVDGRVLVDVHKERALDAMRARYPARHYTMVDDKAAVLAAMKRAMGDDLTTVFVRQGHYAAQAEPVEPEPDHAIERIADLLDHVPIPFAATARAVPATNTQERR